jgi:hypothetical protein
MRNFVAHSPHLDLEAKLFFDFALTLHLDRFFLVLHRVEGPVRLWGGWRGKTQAGLGLETRDNR